MVTDDRVTIEKTVRGRTMLRARCPTCGTQMTKFAIDSTWSPVAPRSYGSFS